MQNSLVIGGIDTSVRASSELSKEFLDYLESKMCWMDRFAWLQDTALVLELNLENVRNKIVQEMDSHEVILGTKCRFAITVAPATRTERHKLLKLCPDNGKEKTPCATQTIALGRDRCVTLKCDTREGGTGSHLWRGGVLLAQQLVYWYDSDRSFFDKLFSKRSVLELGAGCAGLPSIALATISAGATPVRIVASDSMEEVVQALKENVSKNHVDVEVETIDWTTVSDGSKHNQAYECILFADCIYTENGAAALQHAIDCLLVTFSGTVIGVLPAFRPGISMFEASMKQHGSCAQEIKRGEEKLLLDNGDSIPCTGGSIRNYRILSWTCGSVRTKTKH